MYKISAVVGRHSAVKEKDTACEEIIKLQAIVDASTQKVSALEDRVWKPTVDQQELLCKLAVVREVAKGKLVADAKFLRAWDAWIEIECQYQSAKAKVTVSEQRFSESAQECEQMHQAWCIETCLAKVAECDLLNVWDHPTSFLSSVNIGQNLLTG